MGRSDDERDAGNEGAVELSGAPGDGAVDGVVEPAPEAVESVPEVIEAVEVVEAGERQAVWAAWRSLSDESRSLLWRLVIHEEKPRQIAPALGTTSSGVATQGRQARVRFRLALLSELVAHATDPDCREARRQLGGYVRDSLPHGARQSVEDHLDGCASCRIGVADVVDVDAAIRLRVAPALLPGAFAPPDARVGVGDEGGEGDAVGARQVVQEASVPLAVGAASVRGAGEGGGSPGAAVGDPAAAPGWDTAERVLSVPGRSVALVLAAAALVAAVALFVFQLGPTVPATADGPVRGGTPTRSADDTESTYPSEGTTSDVAPSPVIGVATAESVLRYQSASAGAGGSGGATGPGSMVRQARSTTTAGGASGRPTGSTTGVTSPSTPSAPTTPGPSTTRPGPVGAVTSLRLAPSDRGYLAHLQVPTGWLITSVQDVRGGRPRERLSSPTAVYDGRLLGGDLAIEVTRVSPDVTGAMTALFTDRSGATLPGSGDYPLR